MIERTHERTNDHASMHASEMQRWVDLRRSVLGIVAAIHRVIPKGVYTLDVQIIPRDSGENDLHGT